MYIYIQYIQNASPSAVRGDAQQVTRIHGIHKAQTSHIVPRSLMRALKMIHARASHGNRILLLLILLLPSFEQDMPSTSCLTPLQAACYQISPSGQKKARCIEAEIPYASCLTAHPELTW